MNNTIHDNSANQEEYKVADLFESNKEKHASLIRAIKSMEDIFPNIIEFPIVIPEYLK